MKKLNKITAALASLALVVAAFTGCPSSNPDLEAVGDLSGFYIRGELYEDGWSITTEDNLLVADTEKGDIGFYYAKFKALGASGQWKIANSDWTSQYNQNAGNMTIGSLPDGVTDEPVDDGNGGLNECFVGLTEGQWYKINVIASATSVEVSMEETTADETDSVSPFYLDAYFILGPEEIGGTSNWGASLSTLLCNPTKDSDGNLTYTYTFTAGAEAISFGIGQQGWANCYNNGSEFVFGTDTEPKVLASGNTANNKVSGLTIGNTYFIKVYTTPEKVVSFSVSEPLYLTIEFNVSGFEASAEGLTAILAGNFCNWGWTSAWGGSEKVSTRANGEILANGTAVLTYTTAVEKGQEIKIGEFCGYYGTCENDDIATADGELKSGDLDAEGKAKNFSCDYTIKVTGTETYSVTGIVIGGSSASITCAKKN